MLKHQPQRNGNRFRPLESTLDYSNPGGIYKGELQSTISNRMVATLLAGYGGNEENYWVGRSKYANAVPGNPSKLHRDTTLQTGSAHRQQFEHARSLADGWKPQLLPR